MPEKDENEKLIEEVAAIVAGAGGPAGHPDVYSYWCGLKHKLMKRKDEVDTRFSHEAKIAAYITARGGPAGRLHYSDQIDLFLGVYRKIIENHPPNPKYIVE